MLETVKIKSGKISLLPDEKSLTIYRNKKEILKLSLSDGQSLLTCALNFAMLIIPDKNVCPDQKK
jgi:hypothetical protein